MSPVGASRLNPGRRVVVDGSNLATEGRNTPSLAQLDEAVRAFHSERPDDEIIVVVDASFGYRIDESERKIFEEAEEAGEIVSPPAGAIGRGDGFLLRIADRIDADVLSNDSFQEFHGEYLWLFEEGRLMGGKPVPGVGWIFTPRNPVRGPKSRVATRDADRARKRTAPVVRSSRTSAAIAVATAEAIAPDAPSAAKPASRRRSRAGTDTGTPEAINEPLPFITFIADHPLGTEVEGTVEGFTSHGAFVLAGGARCYAPVSGLGDPAPRSAKEVLVKGEVRMFVIQALDPPRRGIELALPGLAKVAGKPTEETVEAEIEVAAYRISDIAKDEDDDEPAPAPAPKSRSRRGGGRKAAAPPVEVDVASAVAPAPAVDADVAVARPRRSRKVAPVAPAPAVDAEVAVAPSRPRRGAKAAVKPEADLVAPAPVLQAEPASPARPRRSTVRDSPAPIPVVGPTPVPRARRKAAPAASAVVPAEVAPPKATRIRKQTDVSVAETPVKAARPRKRAAAVGEPPVPAPEPTASVPAKKAASKGAPANKVAKTGKAAAATKVAKKKATASAAPTAKSAPTAKVAAAKVAATPTKATKKARAGTE